MIAHLLPEYPLSIPHLTAHESIRQRYRYVQVINLVNDIPSVRISKCRHETSMVSPQSFSKPKSFHPRHDLPVPPIAFGPTIKRLGTIEISSHDPLAPKYRHRTSQQVPEYFRTPNIRISSEL